jgi:hypothetical protein
MLPLLDQAARFSRDQRASVPSPKDTSTAYIVRSKKVVPATVGGFVEGSKSGHLPCQVVGDDAAVVRAPVERCMRSGPQSSWSRTDGALLHVRSSSSSIRIEGILPEAILEIASRDFSVFIARLRSPTGSQPACLCAWANQRQMSRSRTASGRET